ncbi:MAG: ABC transporter permease [Prevotella sp.]|uniref:ABC transporter permease n=1 Tax=Hallella faecis TaxID=2841596 RepID=A0ABV1FSF0_9BACT|nr:MULTISPECIES: ABC transporter permease [Hallella]MCI7433292.1 ABC transporter permease [Prevotella sp.]MBU0290572.1 ABC transporter permease [Hallella faecis]MDD7144872.1 ABC transporter permease [Hallella sp.]MDY5926064.1 FtsX-like permease family protein [Hallella sp.]MED9944677.1 FtsX-like permease family protein [Hallella sp.]
MNFSFFIAHKLYKDKGGRQHVSRPAITIATAGVAIGLVVMLLSVFVVLGFKHTIRDKVIGFGSHIQVTNFMTQMSSDQAPIAMNDSMIKVIGGIEGVKHVERFAYKQGILKTDTDFLGVMFEGVAQEYDTTFIHQNMVAGSIPKFSDSQSGNHILISQNIADKLKVNAGDRIFAYFIDENGVRMRRFTIQGIYQTNLSQYDQVMCFADLYTTVKLNAWQPDQVSGAAITVNDFKQLDEVESRFVEKINRTEDRYGETYATQTIRDINPQIFSWLDLLDMNVWIILVLMVSVAGVTMISGLLIIILERTTMIGVLKALGTRNKTIRHIFLWFAAFIIGRALLIGNAIALGMALLQQWTGIIKLDPATYYVSTVPVEINIPLLIILNVATLLISLFVLIAPSYLISHIHPAKSMRYE